MANAATSAAQPAAHVEPHPDAPEAAAAPAPPSAAQPPLVEDELLVEDVSIDGMCGVY